MRVDLILNEDLNEDDVDNRVLHEYNEGALDDDYDERVFD